MNVYYDRPVDQRDQLSAPVIYAALQVSNSTELYKTKLIRWHYGSAPDQQSEGCGFEAY